MPNPDRVPSPSAWKAYAIPGSTLRSVPSPDADETLPLLSRQSATPPETLGMRCLSCHAPVAKSTTSVSIERSGCRLSWDAVPAWVCSHCGSSYFEPQEVQRIRQAVRTLRTLAR